MVPTSWMGELVPGSLMESLTSLTHSRRRTRGGRRRITTEDAHVDPSRFAATVSTWRVMTDGSSKRTGVDQRRPEPRGERCRTAAEDKHVADGGRSARHEHVVARSRRQTDRLTAAQQRRTNGVDQQTTQEQTQKLRVYYSINNHVSRRQPNK